MKDKAEYAVDVRYGDDFYLPPRGDADRAARIARDVQVFVLAKFAAAGISPVRGTAGDAHVQGPAPQDPNLKT